MPHERMWNASRVERFIHSFWDATHAIVQEAECQVIRHDFVEEG